MLHRSHTACWVEHEAPQRGEERRPQWRSEPLGGPRKDIKGKRRSSMKVPSTLYFRIMVKADWVSQRCYRACGERHAVTVTTKPSSLHVPGIRTRKPGFQSSKSEVSTRGTRPLPPPPPHTHSGLLGATRPLEGAQAHAMDSRID